MSNIRRELEDLTHIGQEDSEKYQDYLMRLLDESDKVIGTCDTIWGSLDDETCRWIDSGVEAINKKQAIPDFFDVIPEENESKKELGEEPEEERTEKLGNTITAVDAKEGNVYLVDGLEVECVRKTSRSVVFETGEGERIRTLPDHVIDIIRANKEEVDTESEKQKPPVQKVDTKPEKQKPPIKKAADEKKPKRKVTKISVGRRIKEIVCENLDFDEGDVAKKLKKEGLKTTPNNIRTEYANARVVIDKLRSLGKLSDE